MDEFSSISYHASVFILPYHSSPPIEFFPTQIELSIRENCCLLGYSAATSGKFLHTFRENLSVSPSRSKMGPISCPTTSVRNYQYWLRNSLEERSSHLLRGGSLKSLTLHLSFLYAIYRPSERNCMTVLFLTKFILVQNSTYNSKITKR